ncbi:MAG: deoxynucleoside kinase [Chitinophagales bacterium]|nr:deoxynucleoside kinase [Bacteroidota bacterium]MCB9042647.1 deoxynucleoside kinase [Chitinophagales bacterium]
MLHYNFITVEGNTGAGKTSLAQRLAQDYGGKLILETFADNPFLADSYAQPEAFAFRNEVYFLMDRVEHFKQEIQHLPLYNSLHISDYVFEKSLLYAKVTLPDIEYQLFERVFNMVHNQIPLPELLIYVHSTPDRLIHNIRKRGRMFEQVVRRQYLQDVEDVYFNYFEDNKHQLRILIVHADDIDFVHNENDYHKIVEALQHHYLPGIHDLRF